MNILISTNSKYIMPTIVMLQSLFENNTEKIELYVLHSKLSEKECNQIESFVKSKKNGSVYFLKINKALFADAPISERFTEEIYYRLLAQDILPKNLERVLYLDVDMIINKSLNEFYYQDFEDNYLVVCEGIGMSKKDLITYKNLDIPFDKKYFNSGVILYNLSLLRKQFDTKIFFKYIKEKSHILTMPDQDVLNAIFYDRVKYNDYKIYNYGIVHIKGKEEKRFVRNNTAIIHYIGNKKPWNYDYLLELDDIFWNYAKNTEYKNQFKKYKFKNLLYRIIGKPLFLSKILLVKFKNNFFAVNK